MRCYICLDQQIVVNIKLYTRSVCKVVSAETNLIVLYNPTAAYACIYVHPTVSVLTELCIK